MIHLFIALTLLGFLEHAKPDDTVYGIESAEVENLAVSPIESVLYYCFADVDAQPDEAPSIVRGSIGETMRGI